jgi:hypothetical protein
MPNTFSHIFVSWRSNSSRGATLLALRIQFAGEHGHCRYGDHAQLEQNLEIAESFIPMTDEERLSFFKDIIPLVRPEKIRWKAADWDNPTQWVSRGRGLPG